MPKPKILKCHTTVVTSLFYLTNKCYISQNTTWNCITIWFLYGYARVLDTNLKNIDDTKGQSQKHFFSVYTVSHYYHTVFLFVSILYEKWTDCLTTLSALHMWKMTRTNSCTKYTYSVIKPLSMQATSLAKHYRSAASQFCRSVLHLAGRSQWDGFLKCQRFYLDLMSHRAFV